MQLGNSGTRALSGVGSSGSSSSAPVWFWSMAFKGNLSCDVTDLGQVRLALRALLLLLLLLFTMEVGSDEDFRKAL